MWSAILKGASALLSIILMAMNRIRERRLEDQGASRARQKTLEDDRANTRRANEIDREVDRAPIDQLDDADRMRQRD